MEYKDDLHKDSGTSQAATIGSLLGARFCISTDNVRSFWFLSDAEGAHLPILDETGHNYAILFVSPSYAGIWVTP